MCPAVGRQNDLKASTFLVQSFLRAASFAMILPENLILLQHFIQQGMTFLHRKVWSNRFSLLPSRDKND
jgi:hypothetical protein